ncbi:MAG: hypothetical protein K2J34_04265, partial [Muribaculaceae bacterium]|nr:hypothetical protein [Muribaculaceae bacterium]
MTCQEKKSKKNLAVRKIMINFAVANAKRCDCKDFWSDARVAEEARLESVYTPKAYPEFESRS